MLTSSPLSQYPPLSHVAGLGMYLPFSLRHWSLLFWRSTACMMVSCSSAVGLILFHALRAYCLPTFFG